MNSFFSSKVYLDGLRRIWLLGSISSGVFLVLIILAELTFTDAILLSYFYVWFVPFLLGYKVFNFLWKRNQSDKLLLPVEKCSRICGSHTLAVFSWTAVTLVITFIVRAIISPIASSVMYASHGIYFFSLGMGILPSMLLPALLFSVSVVVFSAAIGGSRLISFLVSFFIVIVPPLLKAGYVQLALQLFPGATANQIPLLGHNVYYSVFDIIFMDYGYDPNFNFVPWLLSQAQDIVYTLSYAIFFFLVAAWLFNRRKSEIAGTHKLNLPFKPFQK